MSSMIDAQPEVFQINAQRVRPIADRTTDGAEY